MGLRFEKIVNFIRNIANRVDAKVVMDIAWKIPLKRAQIQKLEEQVSKYRVVHYQLS